MSAFIVQRFVGRELDGGPHWEDVEPILSSHLRPPVWEADEPGEAFRQAVIENRDARLDQTSYRVLPFVGGATFNVGVDVAGHEHRVPEEVVE